MIVWLDALLAYLHYTSIFLLFAFLTVQIMLVRGPLDERSVRLLARSDLWFFASAIATLSTGFLRAFFGAKGPDFYFFSWPIYAKIALFLAIVLLSVSPTRTFWRWRRSFQNEPSWRVPDEERRRVRRMVMIEVHIAAVIPLVAVIMARGLLT